MQPDGQVGPGSREVDRHRPGGVAQVPQHQRAALLRPGGDPWQVEQGAGAEVDVGEREQGDVVVDRGERVGGVAPAQLQPEQLGHGGGDIAVGRERRGLQDQHASVRSQPGRGDRGLEQAHRGAVAEVEVGGGHPEQRGDPGCDPADEVHPAGVVPGADQPLAPLAPHHVGDALRDAVGERPEGVPVEVDQPLGQVEAAGAGDHRDRPVSSNSRSRARTTRASKVSVSTSAPSTGVSSTWVTHRPTRATPIQ